MAGATTTESSDTDTAVTASTTAAAAESSVKRPAAVKEKKLGGKPPPQSPKSEEFERPKPREETYYDERSRVHYYSGRITTRAEPAMSSFHNRSQINDIFFITNYKSPIFDEYQTQSA